MSEYSTAKSTKKVQSEYRKDHQSHNSPEGSKHHKKSQEFWNGEAETTIDTVRVDSQDNLQIGE